MLELTDMGRQNLRKISILKAVLLVLLIVAALGVFRFTPLREFLTVERLSRSLDAAGIWAPIVYILVYTAGVCLFIPGTLLTTLGRSPLRSLLGIYLCMGRRNGRGQRCLFHW